MNIAHEDTLSIAEVANLIGVSAGKVRRLIEERHLVVVQVDREYRIPAVLLQGNEPIPAVRGTILLLEDAGFTLQQAIEWLFEENEHLDATPIAALQQGHKAPVRRAVQMLA